ncbi:uncharacterized protein LOC103713357 isoform X4 [Phoenix dactylifera]|uniref:Uncharacterized protein LOC103713357 isoform X4 n=1 Tax=Phoenix dactylifera TaxID=42345 RepID=A0A8B9AKF2_PHODC|nr:uncharacterized protein LOC103713357 isoform X4 [Phoenix dactylifera]
MEMVPELPRRASGEDPDDQLRVPLGSGRHRSSGRHPFDPKKTASTHRRTYGTSSYRVSALPPRRVSVPMIADLGCIRDSRWKNQSHSRKIKSSKSIGKGWLSQVCLDLHMLDQLATTGTSPSILQIYKLCCMFFFLTGFLPLYRFLQMSFSVGPWIYLSFSHTWGLPLGGARIK